MFHHRVFDRVFVCLTLSCYDTYARKPLCTISIFCILTTAVSMGKFGGGGVASAAVHSKAVVSVALDSLFFFKFVFFLCLILVYWWISKCPL